MYKKRLKLFLFVLSMATYQHLFAHGSGGNGSSYDFDKRDYAAERKAATKSAKEKQDQDTWADFMKVVNDSSKEEKSEKDHEHHFDTSIQ